MSNISADNIKKLREQTGAGMMDCKNALLENGNDIDKSISWLRKKGIANAEKKSSRVASEGLIGFKNTGKIYVLLEVNTETDFVSKNIDFQNFVENLLNICVISKHNIESLMNEEYKEGTDVATSLQSLIAKIGENIVIRRISYIETENDHFTCGSYLHNKINNSLGKMGCITKLKSDINNDKIAELSNKVAMHVTASKPLGLDKNSIDKEIIEKEKDIYYSQLKSSGKPENILEKIIDGKIKKFLSDITLLNQKWILDPSFTVEEVINNFNKENNCNISIIDYKLFILGDGIEVEEKSFSEEVASQIKNTS